MQSRVFFKYVTGFRAFFSWKPNSVSVQFTLLGMHCLASLLICTTGSEELQEILSLELA